MIPNAGPNSAIARQVDRQTQLTVATAAADSVAADVRACSGLQMLVPAGAVSQTVSVYVCDTFDGTYVPLNDSASAPVTFDVVASNAYDLPEALFSAHYVKFVAGTTLFSAVLLAKG